MNDSLAPVLDTIRKRAQGRSPKMALVLGSGLGALASELEDSLVIPYTDLPGFPQRMVEGHGGDLMLGRLGGCEVAVLRGRTHYYQNGRADGMREPLRVLRALGCEVLCLTNAAASLRPEVQPGSLVLVTDHINFSGTNPLIGQEDASAFVDMTDAYDPALRKSMLAAAAQEGIALHEGVYLWFSGPSFETPAEIRAARALGAEVVGMSTVPETILGRQGGFRVLAVSAITNLGAGLDDQPLDHKHTLEKAAEAAGRLATLLKSFLRGLQP